MTAKAPTRLVKLRDSLRGRKPAAEPVVDLPLDLMPPTTLCAKAKAVWHDVAPSLVKAGILTLGDRHMFAVYCETYAQWMQAQIYVRKHMNAKDGQSVTDLNLRMKIADKTQAQLITLAQHFGMTPVSRKHVDGKVTDEENPFSKLRSVKNGKA